MPTKITYDSLAEAKDLQRLNNDLKNVGDRIMGIKNNLNNIKKADSKGISSLNTETKKLAEEEKRLIKIQKDQEAAKKSLDKQRQRGLTQMAKQEAKERELQGAMKMEVRTLNDLMKKNNALVAARKRVNLTTEEGQKKYRKLTNEISKNNDSLKKYDAAIGNHQRNVGNYSSALQGIPGPMGRATSAAQSFGMMLRTISKIPLLLFITAIVGALTGLAKLFFSTDSGATALEATLNSMKAVFAILKRAILDFATNIGDSFKIAGLWVQKLWAKIKGNTERVQELNEEIDHLKGNIEANNPFENLGEKARRAANEVYRLTGIMDELTDAMISSISEQKELELAMERYRRLAKDQTTSDEQRLRYFELALAKTKQFYGMQRKFAREQFKNEIKMEAARREVNAETLEQFIRMGHKEQVAARKNNEALAEFWEDAGDDRVEELEKMYVSMLDADVQYEKRARELVSQLSGFRKKMMENAKKAVTTKDIRADIDAFINYFETQIDKIEIYSDSQAQEDRDKIKEGMDEITATLQTKLENIKQVRSKYGLFTDEELLREETRALKDQYDNNEIDYETYQLALTAIQKREAQKRIDDQKAMNQAVEQEMIGAVQSVGNALSQLNAAESQRLERQLQEREESIDRLKSLLDEELEAQENKDANSVRSLQQRIDQEDALREKAVEQLRENQKREAQIQLLSQATSITTAVAKAIEYFTASVPIAGVALGIAAAASIIAAFSAYKQRISSEAGAFKDGIIDFKGDGTETSDSNRVLISNRESVITAKGTKKAPKTLDMINKGLISDQDIMKTGFFSNRGLFDLNIANNNDKMISKLEENTTETRKLRLYLQNKPDYVSFKPGVVYKMKGYSREIIRE